MAKWKGRRTPAIVGVYSTAQGYFPERSTLSLYAEGIKAVLDDAGIKKEEVDGIADDWSGILQILDKSKHSPWGFPTYWSHYLRTEFKWSYPIAGVFAVWHAANAIANGLCDVVLIPNAMCTSYFMQDVGRQGLVHAISGSMQNEFVSPWGTILPHWFAAACRLHMEKYGTTREQLAEISVAERAWALKNPQAMMYKAGPLTIEDCINAKPITEPFHLYDCCLANDGGYFILMTTKERARDCKKTPVYVLGGGERWRYTAYINAPIGEWFPTVAVETGNEAFGSSGVTRDDIDVFELYDCFTFELLKQIEDLGYCKQGEGGPFVEGGTLGPGGKMPNNTHGGLLSHGHSGTPPGTHVVEGVKQLRGESTGQIEGAKLALVHTCGMEMGIAATVVLGKE